MTTFSLNYSYGSNDQPAETAKPEAKIEFLCEPDLLSRIPHPQRAVRFTPEWYKSLKRELDVPMENGMQGLSAKACLPMTDVFSLGYIIPLPFDVLINVPEDRVSIQLGWAEDVPFQPVEQHHPGQIGAPNEPFEQIMPLKFINPWQIVVPDGYSVLFTPPANQFNLPFTCFSALVDCDRFATTINFPFAWTGAVGERVLEAGTPMIQLVPIARDHLLKDHTVRQPTPFERDQRATASNRKYDEVSTYSKDWRVKK